MTIIFRKKSSGSISTIKKRQYFPRCEFHCRFPSLFAMDESVRWNTYHRSTYKNIAEVKAADAKFKGNQTDVTKGMYAKTGNYYNPFHFSSYKKYLEPKKRKDDKATQAEWYDRILLRQKTMAADIVKAVLKKNKHLKINSDNSYPCVLFSLPKPEAEKNVKVWTQFLEVFLVAITNKLAYERGLNIEMLHRSSFGHLRPSVAECGESVRINLGLIPNAYADCIIDAILYLAKLFANKKLAKVTFESTELTKKLKKYNKKHSIKNKKVNIQLKKTVFETLWAAGDSSNRSFATQIFRTPLVTEYLVDLIFNACLEQDLEDIFEDEQLVAKTFTDPLKEVLNKITLNKKAQLTIDVDFDALKSYEWQDVKPVKDDEFWNFIADLAKALNVSDFEIKTLQRERITEDLHSRFEVWEANFFFHPQKYDDVVNGVGSDSEESAIIANQTIYAKKLTTATAMRAIQLCYAVSKQYLYSEYRIDPLYISFIADQMYYETDEALQKHAIPIAYKDSNKLKAKNTNIGFFDINHCNTGHNKNKDILSLIEKDAKICVLDVTSSTSLEIHETLESLLQSRKKLEVILTVSSGIKNEQAMADYNPYGTVRIFCTTEENLEYIYNNLIDLEQIAEYEHPKESHWIRKTAKDAGMTMTNGAIFKAKTAESSNSSDSESEDDSSPPVKITRAKKI